MKYVVSKLGQLAGNIFTHLQKWASATKNRGLGADRLIGIGSHDRTKHKFSGAEMG